MSDDLDPRLAELLRRGPPPPAGLEPQRRAAILAEARQAWFRARSGRRRTAWATAIAACLVAGIAGWMLRAVAEPTLSATPAPVVVMPLRPEPQALRARDQGPARENSAAPSQSAIPAAESAAPAPRPQSAPRADVATLRQSKPTEATETAKSEADAPAAMALENTVVAAKPAAALPAAAPPPPAAPAAAGAPAAAAADSAVATRAPMRLQPAAAAKSKAGMTAGLDEATLGAPERTPLDARQRGRLLAAAAIVQAVKTQTSPPEDRAAALQAAFDLVAGIDHPAADELRRAIAAALRQR